MDMMKAVQFHEYGGPEVLRFEDAPRPSPANDEILVRVHAAGVNPVDGGIRAGRVRSLSQRLPQVAGLDFAGTVEQVGKKVRGFRVGDAVYGRPQFGHGGAYAQYVVVKPTDVAKKPRSLDFAHAAALPTAALAAWQALFESDGTPTMRLSRGQTVLIHGASGGVGTFAVQLAKWIGATVIGTGRTENLQFLKELGVDVVVDYTQQRFEDFAHQVDGVLDVVGGETQARSWDVLKKGGVLVSTVGIQSEEPAKARGVRAIAIMAGQDPRVLAEIAKLVDKGVIKVPLSEELPLERAREAQEHIQSGHTRGKIVLDVH